MHWYLDYIKERTGYILVYYHTACCLVVLIYEPLHFLTKLLNSRPFYTVTLKHRSEKTSGKCKKMTTHKIRECFKKRWSTESQEQCRLKYYSLKKGRKPRPNFFILWRIIRRVPPATGHLRNQAASTNNRFGHVLYH